jgi:hypothetical protein
MADGSAFRASRKALKFLASPHGFETGKPRDSKGQ